MIKLAPVSNAAARKLRDNGLTGLALILVGVFWLALADDRVFRAGAACPPDRGFATMLPTLIARGIRLERESRE